MTLLSNAFLNREKWRFEDVDATKYDQIYHTLKKQGYDLKTEPSFDTLTKMRTHKMNEIFTSMGKVLHEKPDQDWYSMRMAMVPKEN